MTILMHLLMEIEHFSCVIIAKVLLTMQQVSRIVLFFAYLKDLWDSKKWFTLVHTECIIFVLQSVRLNSILIPPLHIIFLL